MRAVCESCALPQPADWQPGDLCIHCGRSVRRELRCFWCVHWTPASKFCRSCGAATVEPRLFAAARMLKDAGVDRFALPKLLAGLDPEQIDTYTNIYQRHAAILARHLDHVRFLEPFLQHKQWSAALEEELLPQLPWPDDRLPSLSPPLHPAEAPVAGARSRPACLALARAIAAITPFPRTATLANLVRLLLEDFEPYRASLAALSSSDPLLQGEAALALTNWRVVYGPGIQDERYLLIDALRACPFTYPAAIHRVMIGDRDAALPPDALASPDPDLAFSAALASGDVTSLIAAEHDSDPMKRYVAAWRIIRADALTGVEPVLRAAAPPHQLDLLQQIAYRKKPAFELRDACFDILESTDDRRLRQAACSALAFAHQFGDALRIARAAGGDTTIYQSLLQRPAMTPEDLAAFCEFLLATDAFRAEQWGMSDIARAGRLPIEFVPSHWNAAGESARVEMLKFAEMQLGQSQPESEAQASVEALHRFLVERLFADDRLAVQRQAWISLFRWYGRSEQFQIEAAPLTRFFGSVTAFVPHLTRFLGAGNPGEILQDLSVRESLRKLLRYAAPDIVPFLRDDVRPTLDLAAALAGVMRHEQCEFTLRLACVDLLALLAEAPELRRSAVDLLRPFRGTDLDLAVTQAMSRLSLSNSLGPV